MSASLLLVALLSTSPQDVERVAGSDPLVLEVDGRGIRRSEYQEWLLLARGELYAPGFVRLWRLRKEGEVAGIRFDSSTCSELARKEVERRIEGAFNGGRELWLAELERLGRSPAGYLAQRALAIEGEQLLERLEQELGRSWSELLAEVSSPFEFHPGALMQADAEAVVLSIDGTPITRSEYLPWLLTAFGEVDARRIAEATRIEQAALAEEIRVTQEEVEERTESDFARVIEHDYQGDRELWLRDLRLTGRNEEQVRREFLFRKRLDLLVEKLLLKERVVGEDELRRAWEQRHGEGGRDVELRWIRIDVPSGAELESARIEAGGLARRIAAGEDFATLAEQHSDDAATRVRGGRPAKGFRLERLPPPLVPPVRALAAGDVSAPLLHERSVWLFEVTAIHVTPFEQVRAGLLEELRARRPTEVELAAKKTELVRDVDVRVLPAMFAD